MTAVDFQKDLPARTTLTSRLVIHTVLPVRISAALARTT